MIKSVPFLTFLFVYLSIVTANLIVIFFDTFHNIMEWGGALIISYRSLCLFCVKEFEEIEFIRLCEKRNKMVNRVWISQEIAE